MSSTSSLFSNVTLEEMEQQLAELEQALSIDTNTQADELNTDDLFNSFLSSTTPHPSTQSLIGKAGRMVSIASTDSEASSSPEASSSLPPLSPVSVSSLPSPVLSPIGSLVSSFSLSDSSSELSLSSPPSSPCPSPPRPSSRRKYTKRRASTTSTTTTDSSSSSVISSSLQPTKRRGTKRSASPSELNLDELDPVTAKKERRKQQNRNAAATSREKKQKYMAEMELRIEQLIKEQQQLIDDVTRLQEQNKLLKQQVVERENGGVKVETVKEEEQEAVVESADEELSDQSEVSEHVSQDHVSASGADSAVESESDSVDACSEWSGAVSESRDVYYESAVANNADTLTHNYTALAQHFATFTHTLPRPTLDTTTADDHAFTPLTLDDAAVTATDYSFLDSEDFTFMCDDSSADNSWMQTLVA